MYREKKLGPRSPLGHYRYNLTGGGISYSVLGLLFFYLILSAGERDFVSDLLPFLVLGTTCLASGLATFRSLAFARNAVKIHVGVMILYAANFARFAAVHHFESPFYAWSLIGPFGAAASMVVYNSLGLVVTYMWIAYGLNVLAGLAYGTANAFYYASNIFIVVVMMPILANIVSACAVRTELALGPEGHKILY